MEGIHHRHGVGEFLGGGGRETGEPVHRDDLHAAAPRLVAADAHVELEATWGIYQRMIAAYREPDRSQGRTMMTKRADDVLAHFDRPGTSVKSRRVVYDVL